MCMGVQGEGGASPPAVVIQKGVLLHLLFYLPPKKVIPPPVQATSGVLTVIWQEKGADIMNYPLPGYPCYRLNK